MSRAASFLLVFLGACRPPPPAEPLETPPPIPHAEPAHHAKAAPFVPRPDVRIDIAAWVPDATEELRWPLDGMTHPVLEPHYAIAPVFAMPGVAWTELCARGAQNRTLPGAEPDHVTYLRAWCAAGNRDVDRAVDMLARLRASQVPHLAEAVRHDIANIVADAGSGAEAQKLLARALIDDPALDDIVSATFAEVGSLEDAATFNRMALSAYASPAVRCHRLAKRIVIDPSAHATFGELEQLGTTARGAPDPTCARLFALLDCSYRHRCEAQFTATGGDPKRAHLIEAFEGWNQPDLSMSEWLRIARAAFDAMPLDGADQLAAAAIANGARHLDVCDDAVTDLRGAAWTLLNVAHDSALDPQLRGDVARIDRLCPSAKP